MKTELTRVGEEPCALIGRGTILNGDENDARGEGEEQPQEDPS
jgi:hypothetical protein